MTLHTDAVTYKTLLNTGKIKIIKIIQEKKYACNFKYSTKEDLINKLKLAITLIEGDK